MKTVKMWAIAGRNGKTPFLYTGTALTRREAIRDAEQRSGWTWAKLRAKGDRPVKVTIAWEVPRG